MYICNSYRDKQIPPTIRLLPSPFDMHKKHKLRTGFDVPTKIGYLENVYANDISIVCTFCFLVRTACCQDGNVSGQLVIVSKSILYESTSISTRPNKANKKIQKIKSLFLNIILSTTHAQSRLSSVIRRELVVSDVECGMAVACKYLISCIQARESSIKVVSENQECDNRWWLVVLIMIMLE